MVEALKKCITQRPQRTQRKRERVNPQIAQTVADLVFRKTPSLSLSASVCENPLNLWVVFLFILCVRCGLCVMQKKAK
jgi:hypothetical protein